MSARFTVTWHPSAIDELAQIWLSALDRNSVTNAVSAIDAILRNEPQKKGDEFYGDRIIVAGVKPVAKRHQQVGHLVPLS